MTKSANVPNNCVFFDFRFGFSYLKFDIVADFRYSVFGFCFIGDIWMKAQQWRQALGECVRDFFRTPEMEHFYSIKLTPERARIYLLQLGLYARQRRNNWPQVAANCPEFDVKQRILAHEYEELVEDEHSKTGHMDLIVRQAGEVGLRVDEVMNAEPLPTTKAAMYAWFWIARTRPWQEAIAASTIAEWTNDDRLLGDIGGGNCSRLYKIWARDLNFSAAQMPNFTAHSKADVKHSDMFIDVLERMSRRDGSRMCSQPRRIRWTFTASISVAWRKRWRKRRDLIYPSEELPFRGGAL
jgi:pyrroloquinoline quinone (PQQ) biosynthesis protein C